MPGAPSFAHCAKGGSGDVEILERTAVVLAASHPALAKKARTGHPAEGWASPPV